MVYSLLRTHVPYHSVAVVRVRSTIYKFSFKVLQHWGATAFFKDDFRLLFLISIGKFNTFVLAKGIDMLLSLY